MNQKLMNILEEQKEAIKKTYRIQDKTEKLKIQMNKKLEEKKISVERDFKEFGFFLQQSNLGYESYKYQLPDQDSNFIPKGKDHYYDCIFILINNNCISIGLDACETTPCYQYFYKSQKFIWESSADPTISNAILYICTHWEQISSYIEDQLIATVARNNKIQMEKASHEYELIKKKIEVLGPCKKT